MVYSYLGQLLVNWWGSILIGKLNPSSFQYRTAQWSQINGLKVLSILSIHDYTKNTSAGGNSKKSSIELWF